MQLAGWTPRADYIQEVMSTPPTLYPTRWGDAAPKPTAEGGLSPIVSTVTIGKLESPGQLRRAGPWRAHLIGNTKSHAPSNPTP
jgi:hypothetical protein